MAVTSTTSLADLASLAQDFDSPNWNSIKALQILYEHKADRSIVLATCHAMRKLADADLMQALMQLCHLIVVFDLPDLEELLLERCHHSMNFALRMFFLLQAAMEDEVPELVYKTNRLWKQCELAAINAVSTCPPRNRVCVENGSFKRKSQKDLAPSSPSPRLVRSNSCSNSLPSVPTYGNASEALYASTSLLPQSSAMSPPKSHALSKSQSDLEKEKEKDEKEDKTDAQLMEAANVNPELQSPDPTRPTPLPALPASFSTSPTPASPSTPSTSPTPTISTSPTLSTSPNTTTTTTTTSTTTETPLEQLLSETSISRSPPVASTLSSSPPNSADPSTLMTSSIIQPSYASAVPTIDTIRPPPLAVASSSSSPPPPSSPDPQAFGSSFYFKLRQLSGEGHSGNQRVYEYFYTELHMINSLFNISTALMSISLDGAHKLKEVRGRALQLLLAQINTQLIQTDTHPPGSTVASSASSPSSSVQSSTTSSAVAGINAFSLFMDESLTYGVEIPVVPGWVIVKIHPEDSFCLSSRNRVPYMMLIEVLAFDPESDNTTLIENQPQHQTRYHTEHSSSEDSGDEGEDDWVLLSDEAPRESTLKKGFIELWSEKEKRIRETSPFSQLPGWRLAGVIVKSGDDLRQEQLASQLIFKIHSWFQAEKLPLFLRPYVVLATSSTTGLIECIPDTCSIDSLKKRIPNFGSLSNYFICSYGHKTSHKFIVAQTNFIESLAAYSIVCYLLQIKDRHNGNILLDVEGHMIHIDFGFMLSISPGNLGFELAPFKLNQEMIDLMGGVQSDMFKYFKTLLLSGLLEVRRHADELLLLVDVMTTHSKMACFSRGGAQVLAGLRERLALDKSEEQCIGLVDTLVYNAMRSWTTQQYDSYQYYTNGIL
eukprot:Phypoly_transcript_02190.p1 GENE.Phypoly_transcript_02190~~Phypoly_transcript_02190.p1  ORF type:complete len:886 (+),score=181.00 Phypoly_transcript_02190:128-2785(+)